jgi:hypothetical protein
MRRTGGRTTLVKSRSDADLLRFASHFEAASNFAAPL